MRQIARYDYMDYVALRSRRQNNRETFDAVVGLPSFYSHLVRCFTSFPVCFDRVGRWIEGYRLFLAGLKTPRRFLSSLQALVPHTPSFPYFYPLYLPYTLLVKFRLIYAMRSSWPENLPWRIYRLEKYIIKYLQNFTFNALVISTVVTLTLQSFFSLIFSSVLQIYLISVFVLVTLTILQIVCSTTMVFRFFY